MKNEKKTKKIVFKEAADTRPKILYGTVKENENFFIITTTLGNIFTVNKDNIVFIKESLR